MRIDKELDNMLKKVEKPARYIGGEVNSIKKDPEKVSVRMGFAFPDTYEIGMSYMGLQILYNILNKNDDIYCERVFAPAMDMEELMRECGRERVTLETFTPVKELDILGFTLQYELSYTNVLNMLQLGNIPLRSCDRGEEHPVIIAGGPCAYNPEPLADFIDVFLIGDGEEL
ncbi:MAG: B12-binding domain-containing radical SAM protein, partial [Firmicutes bacterium]|nr:B12-binding domain-containing radical SAM protein [Bacillota bacterium]